MTIAKASRARLAFGRESTYGTAPSAGVFRTLRRLSASLAVKPLTAQSGEVRSDRQRVKPIVVGKQTGGDVGAELIARGYDSLIEGALFNALTKTPELSVSSVAAGTGVYTVTSGGAAVLANMLVGVDSLTNAINTSYHSDGAIQAYLVSASTGTTVTTDNAASVVEAGSTGTLKVVGQQIATGDLAISASGGRIVFTLTAGSWPTGMLQAGQWIYVGGVASAYQLNGSKAAQHMGWYRIYSVAAKILAFDIFPYGADGDGANANAGGGKTPRVYYGDFGPNGTTFFSYAIERSFLDISAFELFTGLGVNTMSVELGERSIAKLSFGFVGKDGVPANAAYASTPLAATGNAPFSTSANVGAIAVGGVGVLQAITTDAIRNASLGINNGIQELPALGTASGVIGIVEGECNVSGKLTAYFADLTLYNALFNNTDSQFASALRNARGGAMVCDVPRLNFTDGSPQLAQGSDPVTMELPFSASVHETLGYTIGLSLLDLVGF